MNNNAMVTSRGHHATFFDIRGMMIIAVITDIKQFIQGSFMDIGQEGNDTVSVHFLPGKEALTSLLYLAAILCSVKPLFISISPITKVLLLTAIV